MNLYQANGISGRVGFHGRDGRFLDEGKAFAALSAERTVSSLYYFRQLSHGLVVMIMRNNWNEGWDGI